MSMRDRLPRRIANPLERVQSHVARRAGAHDPIRERRKRRDQERQPILEPGLPSELVRVPGDLASLTTTVAGKAAASHAHTATMTTITTNLAILAGAVGTADVVCQAGTVCTGGGVSSNGAAGTVWVHSTLPLSTTTWRGAIFNNGGGTITMTVWAQCLEDPIT